MTSTQLRNHPTVLKLAEIQQKLGLNDIPFAKALRLGMHGANWGKIKAGTYDGNFSRSLLKLDVALADHSAQGTGETEDGIVILDHVQTALDAVDIAMVAEDEHRLVVLSGPRGSGKSRTLSILHSRHGGHSMAALPSWSGGYLNFLNKFAAGIGLHESRSAGSAETLILTHLGTSSGLITIDEFNYFSPAAINFLKAVLNDTRWVIATATVPHYLARMAADRQTSQEASQLLRRAVAIIHIPTVTSRAVEQIQRAFHPHLDLSGQASSVASAANRIHRLDSVCAILSDAEDSADIPAAIARHERATKTALRPGE